MNEYILGKGSEEVRNYIKCGFSEKLFEFAVNNEMLRKYGNIHLVDLKEEKKFNYDALFFDFTTPTSMRKPSKVKMILFQYKIADFYNIKNLKIPFANYKKIKPVHWTNNEFYRFELDSSLNSDGTVKEFYQHNGLVLAQNVKYYHVYYVAPKFHLLADLHANLYKQTVYKNSAIIPFSRLVKYNPMKKGVDKPFNHYMHYDASNSIFKLCSEEINGQMINSESVLDLFGNINQISLEQIGLDNGKLSNLDYPQIVKEIVKLTLEGNENAQPIIAFFD